MNRHRANDSRAFDGSRDRAPVVAAVLPAYRTASSIRSVIEQIPPDIRHVIVVDDASPDGVSAVVSALGDSRVCVCSHEVNRGVGAAMKTGFTKALDLGADIVVKLDSDGQMDPALIPAFVAPLVEGRADLAKGNRFADLSVISAMPPFRRAGNLVLSFLVKAASGYWSLFDPCNGYLAISSDLLKDIRRDRLAAPVGGRRYELVDRRVRRVPRLRRGRSDRRFARDRRGLTPCQGHRLRSRRLLRTRQAGCRSPRQ